MLLHKTEGLWSADWELSQGAISQDALRRARVGDAYHKRLVHTDDTGWRTEGCFSDGVRNG